MTSSERQERLRRLRFASNGSYLLNGCGRTPYFVEQPLPHLFVRPVAETARLQRSTFNTLNLCGNDDPWGRRQSNLRIGVAPAICGPTDC